MYYLFYLSKFELMKTINSILKIVLLNLIMIFVVKGFSQTDITILQNLNELPKLESGTHNYWLNMGSNTYGQPILIPIIVIQGQTQGPTLGLTAAIHGNELNGIAIIHQLV